MATLLPPNLRILPVIGVQPWTHRNRLIWRLLLLCLGVVATLSLIFASLSPAGAAENRPQPTLPTIRLLINDTPLLAEVAANGQQRYMGLSFRPSMDEHKGMLFVYQRERPLTFTMRNTLIPLSIAFISSDMVINEIHDMDVGPGQLFDSRKPAQFALEVNQGWFDRHGIEPGAKILMQ